MQTFEFDFKSYLLRINYRGEVSLSSDSLKGLHHAQLTSIPFENFDICLNKRISLDRRAVFDKLVNHKRGGYCFELNGLMLMTLQYLGFDARALLGRVHISGTATGRTHQISLVTLNKEQWVVDVGFGAESLPEPLPLVLNTSFVSCNKTLRFVEDGLFGFMLQVEKQEGWLNLYSFDLSHVCEADIKQGNHFTSTSSDSIFFNSRIASLPTENGRITLSNFMLKKVLDGREKLTQLQPGPTYLTVLKDNFGIDLECTYDCLKDIVDDSKNDLD